MATFFGPGGYDSGSFDEFLARMFGGSGFGPGGFGQSGQGGFGPQQRRVDIMELMTEPAQRLMSEAGQYANTRGHNELDALHILHAAATNEQTRDLLRGAGADPDQLAEAAERELPNGSEPQQGQQKLLSSTAQRVLANAHQVAQATSSNYIAPEHVLLAMSADQESPLGRILGAAGVTPQSLQSQQHAGSQSGAAAGKQGGGETPTLDKYGQDLTQRARDGGLDPVIGRGEEIEQTIEVLSRRNKNNPVLVGDAGVGKTAIVEGIAQRIVDDDVPSTLANRRVVQLDVGGMLAGTRYRGDFEERMGKVIDEVSQNSGEIIVFIDEIHTVVGAGGAEGSVDAGNMLKPRLARGDLHVIGATTLDEYRKNIESDAALERRFQQVQVPEPTVTDTVGILAGLQERYEQHHGVHYTPEAIDAAAHLSDRYINDRFLPDKAIDLLDQAGARKRLSQSSESGEVRNLEKKINRLQSDKDTAVAEENFERASELRDEIIQVQQQLSEARGSGETDSAENSEEGETSAEVGSTDAIEVGPTDIAEIISRRTGVPVSQLTENERARLRKLEDELHQRVIGQEDAVASIARSVRRSRSGMGDANRPIGSFLFLGPTGVGKTELAKALAESLFGDSEKMVRLDMSEFGERHTASRLVGAPPGYVGYGEAGELTEKVRRHPYSVILLDEIEKAHPDVFNTLLQVLEDGRLTDGQGRTVDFSNTVLIMTSNLGSEIISSRSGPIGFKSDSNDDGKSLRERLMPRLRESFRPEFLNRIDEVVTFSRLTKEQLYTITDLMLGETRQRLDEQGVTVEFSEAAIDWIAERGHQPEFGARPLRRTIQREVDDSIADLLLDEQLSSGAHLRVDAAEDSLTFEVKESQPAA